MLRRLILLSTLGALAGILVTSLNPIHNSLLKLAFLVCLIGTWLGVSVLVWKRKPARWAALTLPVWIALPFLLPGRDINARELRSDYLRRVAGFEGTTYVWGGESSRGIDCSGLPRRAYRNALLAHGFSSANGRAFRAFLEQWWFDTSAKALGEGYRDFTIPLGDGDAIQSMDCGKLLPGDLALTFNGVHVLVYAGAGKWIQADPGLGAVATLDGRADENPWFEIPVTTHRWSLLTGD